MTLRYPSDLNFNSVDYVTFQAHEYRSNASGESGPATSQRIMLYMPNSTPAVGNENSWGGQSMGEGALGAEKAALAGDITQGIMEVGKHGMEESTNAVIDTVKKRFESLKQNGGAVGRQIGMNVASGVLGYSPNHLLAVNRGEIYNPNIELIYQGPGLRAFGFNFTFIPKNAGESAQINSIIKEFKKYSSASNSNNNGLLKVPDIWQVTYMANGSQNKNMNAFRRAALVGVTVQANSSSTMHNSFIDGMPVATSIKLQFQEVDIILQEDHDEAPTNQGY